MQEAISPQPNHADIKLTAYVDIVNVCYKFLKSGGTPKTGPRDDHIFS